MGATGTPGPVGPTGPVGPIGPAGPGYTPAQIEFVNRLMSLFCDQCAQCSGGNCAPVTTSSTGDSAYIRALEQQVRSLEARLQNLENK